jgi:hypothetical protein
MTTTTTHGDLRRRIDRAAELHEEARGALYRPDGSKVYGEEAHAEREEALRREFHAALDAIGEEIGKRISRAEGEVLRLEHGDPSGALTAEELERAGARRPFVRDEVYGLGTDALEERTRAVIASSDRPAMFVYAHHLRAKAREDAASGSGADGLRLKELAGDLERALDPEGARKLEGARAELEEARGLKDYAHLRRNGARDPVELHMNRVYGRL